MNRSWTFSKIAALFFCCALVACNLIVDPDTSRLAHMDDGSMPPIDAGDAGPMCPAACDDNTPCTVNSCDMQTLMCVFTPIDVDQDGFKPVSVNSVMCQDGNDCDDNNDAIKPGATELCDGVDNDCDNAKDKDDNCRGDKCSNPLTVEWQSTGVANGYNASISANFSYVGGDHDLCGGVSSDYAFLISWPRDGCLTLTQDTTGDFNTGIQVRLTSGDSCNGGSGTFACGAPVVITNEAVSQSTPRFLIVKANDLAAQTRPFKLDLSVIDCI